MLADCTEMVNPPRHGWFSMDLADGEADGDDAVSSPLRVISQVAEVKDLKDKF